MLSTPISYFPKASWRGKIHRDHLGSENLHRVRFVNFGEAVAAGKRQLNKCTMANYIWKFDPEHYGSWGVWIERKALLSGTSLEEVDIL